MIYTASFVCTSQERAMNYSARHTLADSLHGIYVQPGINYIPLKSEVPIFPCAHQSVHGRSRVARPTVQGVGRSLWRQRYLCFLCLLHTQGNTKTVIEHPLFRAYACAQDFN